MIGADSKAAGFSASILITSYNYGLYLADCIDSALNQTIPVEVVVVDDGSNDGSREIISSYGARVVQVWTNHVGQGGAINAGAALASGSILLLLDADDLALPRRAECVVEVMRRQPEVQWVRHDLEVVDGDGEQLRERLGQRSHDPLAEVVTRGRTFGTTSGLALRRSLFDELGPIPEHYRGYADLFLLVGSALAAPGWSTPEILSARRIHDLHHFTGHSLVNVERAEFHIALRSHIAQDAARLAMEFGSAELVANEKTWWQLKARFDSLKSGLATGEKWTTVWLKHARAIWRSKLSIREMTALTLRSIVLAATPKRFYLPVWWLTNEGRASLSQRLRNRAA